jgi:hypothetical protein
MPVDLIRYDILAQNALRGLVRKVLTDVAKKGLPGEHHFFITFATTGNGVRLSNRLREQYPDEMTIVMQHQFWDLKVTEDAFEVGMSFGGVPERLVVPFEAIRSFADPSVQFALQFETIAEGEDEADTPPAPKPEKADAAKRKASPPALQEAPRATVPAVPAPAAKSQPAKTSADNTSADKTPPEIEPPDDTPDKPSGQVVRLDRFRKK